MWIGHDFVGQLGISIGFILTIQSTNKICQDLFMKHLIP